MIIDKTEEVAQTSADALNNLYVLDGVDGEILAVICQSDKYFTCSIPKARQAEFIASATQKQNDFFQFSITSRTEQNESLTFLEAWEIEYAKIY